MATTKPSADAAETKLVDSLVHRRTELVALRIRQARLTSTLARQEQSDRPTVNLRAMRGGLEDAEDKADELAQALREDTVLQALCEATFRGVPADIKPAVTEFWNWMNRNQVRLEDTYLRGISWVATEHSYAILGMCPHDHPVVVQADLAYDTANPPLDCATPGSGIEYHQHAQLITDADLILRVVAKLSADAKGGK